MRVNGEKVAQMAMDRLFRAALPLSAVWLQTDRDRRALAAEIRASRGERPVLPVVVGGAQFTSMNSLGEDLMQIVRDNREETEGCWSADDGAECQLVVVLLSRSKLALPQLDSPALAPKWFPCIGGQTISVRIEDLLTVTDAPLSCEETQVARPIRCPLQTGTDSDRKASSNGQHNPWRSGGGGLGAGVQRPGGHGPRLPAALRRS